MPNYICVTCGTQFADSSSPPAHCPICEDERQYVGANGQQWTELAELQHGYHNVVKAQEPSLTGIGTEPKFAIGQRALLVQTANGNLLWDCITLLDDATVAAVQALGGVSAIAISHPHYYSSMVQDRRYVSFMRSYPNLIPLPAPAIHKIVQAVEPFPFDRIYGAWWDTIVTTDARASIHQSAARYVHAITGQTDDTGHLAL